MRFLFRAEWPVEAGNEVIKSGKIGETVQSILDELKPEAVYFLASNGKRTALLILDLKDASQIPAVAEPWFLKFNASIEFTPVMLPGDLQKAEPAIKKAVKKYGKA